MSKQLYLENCKAYFKEKYPLFTSKLDDDVNIGFIKNLKRIKDQKLTFEYYQDPSYANSFKYLENKKIGNTLEYELGLIYPQDLASSYTAQCVNTKDIKLVLDLCSAPGGKTIGIYNYLNDDAIIVSNDVNYSRCKETIKNIERLGIDNVIVTNKEIKDFLKYQHCFDLVIIDAPCSGEGMVRKYPTIYDNYSNENINNLAIIQKNIIDVGVKCLKNNGQLLFSTCTYNFIENEENVKYIIDNYPNIKLKKLNDFENNTSRIEGCLKYSFINDTEGQFIALFENNANYVNFELKKLKQSKNNLVEKFIKENINIQDYCLYQDKDKFYLSNKQLYDFGENVIRYGLLMGEISKNIFLPCHHFYRSNFLCDKYTNEINLNQEQYKQYLQGLEIVVDKSNGYYCVKYLDINIGFGKLSNNTLKNKYPKGLRKIV